MAARVLFRPLKDKGRNWHITRMVKCSSIHGKWTYVKATPGKPSKQSSFSTEISAGGQRGNKRCRPPAPTDYYNKRPTLDPRAKPQGEESVFCLMHEPKRKLWSERVSRNYILYPVIVCAFMFSQYHRGIGRKDKQRRRRKPGKVGNLQQSFGVFYIIHLKALWIKRVKKKHVFYQTCVYNSIWLPYISREIQISIFVVVQLLSCVRLF